MELFLEQALRRGVVPGCCGGASVCFAFYAVKVAQGARSWEALAAVTAVSRRDSSTRTESPDEHRPQTMEQDHLSTQLFQVEYARNEAVKLKQHAGTVASLSLTSAALSWQALLDWRQYSKCRTLGDMEDWLLSPKRRPFFLRSPVLMSAVVSLGAVEFYLGGPRLFYWRDFQG